MLRLNTKRLPKDSPLAPALNYVLKLGITLYDDGGNFDPHSCYYGSVNIPIHVYLDLNNYEDVTTLYLMVSYKDLYIEEDLSFETDKYDVELTCSEMFERCIERLNNISYRNDKNEIGTIMIRRLLNRTYDYYPEHVIGKYKLVLSKITKPVLYEDGKVIYEWENMDDLIRDKIRLDLGTAPEILYLLDNE